VDEYDLLGLEFIEEYPLVKRPSPELFASVGKAQLACGNYQRLTKNLKVVVLDIYNLSHCFSTFPK
jgi:hypothetical protein